MRVPDMITHERVCPCAHLRAHTEERNLISFSIIPHIFSDSFSLYLKVTVSIRLLGRHWTVCLGLKHLGYRKIQPFQAFL